jgi:hypothetical protein
MERWKNDLKLMKGQQQHARFKKTRNGKVA